MGASRSGPAALEAEPRPETSGFAEPDLVEDVTEMQLRVLDAVDLDESLESVKVRSKGVLTMLGLVERSSHRFTHWPCRSWCKAYVLGNGREDGHARTTVEDRYHTSGWTTVFPPRDLHQQHSLF